MLRFVIDLKHNSNLWIKEIDAEAHKIVLSIKHQPVRTAGKRYFNQKERLHATVFVGPGMAELGPAFIRILCFKVNGNAAGRSAT